jgi:Bacterial extracellular solute-binding protein
VTRILPAIVTYDNRLDFIIGSLLRTRQQIFDKSFRALATSLRYLFLLGDHLVPSGFQHLRQIPFNDSRITAMDAALEDAARTSGSNNMGVLMRITVPILAPAILASTALGFIRSLESLEIEMVLGIPAGIYVVPTKIWDYIHWEPPLYDRATALCSIFLIFVFFLIWLHRIFLRGKEFTTISGRSYMVRVVPLGRWRWVTFAFCMVFIFVMIILPLVTLMMGTCMEFFGNFDTDQVWTAHHWTAVFADPVFLRSLGPEKAKDFYKKIRAQAGAVDRDQRQQIEWVAQGKYPLNFGPGTVMYQLEKRGLKFGVVSEFKDYGAYLSPGFGTAMFINRAPHPNAAKVFLNWLLTKDGQTAFSTGMGYVSRRVDVSTDHVPFYWVPKAGVKYWPGYYEEDATMSPEQENFLKSIYGR